MPVIRKPAPQPERHQGLIDELAEELRLNQADGRPGGAPRVIEEEVRGSPHLHVIVIWDSWRDIAPEERGRVILDAYNQQRGEKEMLRISSALGVTLEESRRLRVEP